MANDNQTTANNDRIVGTPGNPATLENCQIEIMMTACVYKQALADKDDRLADAIYKRLFHDLFMLAIARETDLELLHWRINQFLKAVGEPELCIEGIANRLKSYASQLYRESPTRTKPENINWRGTSIQQHMDNQRYDDNGTRIDDSKGKPEQRIDQAF